MSYKTNVAIFVACLLAIGVASTPQSALAQQCDVDPPLQQTTLTRPILLGVSGGNIHSVIKTKKTKGCFSGTLGSMVQDSNDVQYILSNNHVLADQNNALRGQLIVQPGKVDVECVKAPSNAVATFSRAIKLKFGGGTTNNVDAAIAAVEPGQVSPEILFIGEISGSPATPTLGMSVQKMGRTTCLTTGVVATLDATVKVNYSDNPKKPKVAKFLNQIVITGSIDTPQFAAAGDSGSLILTEDDCPQPVALLFAGFSNGTTIANPISEVLSVLGVSMVGSCTAALASDSARADVLAGDVGLSTEDVKASAAVRDRHEDQLMSIPGAVGTGIGAGDQPGQAAIVVYVEKMSTQVQAAAPKDIEGLPVKLIESGEAVAL